MTFDAERGNRLREVILELDLTWFADLVRDVSGFAAHIQRRVPASLLRYVQANRVAAQAQIFLGVSRRRLP